MRTLSDLYFPQFVKKYFGGWRAKINFQHLHHDIYRAEGENGNPVRVQAANAVEARRKITLIVANRIGIKDGRVSREENHH